VDGEQVNKALNDIHKYLQMLSNAIVEVDNKIASLQKDTEVPRYLYHMPMDFDKESHAPVFAPPVFVDGVDIPLPPDPQRASYAEGNDMLYLEWGRYDHDFIMELIANYSGITRNMEILDFGCSSGRVLRHFIEENRELGWRLHGCDIQSGLIQWMRENFPQEFNVFTGTFLPHLPFADASLDVIYGISVFTHTKFLWDFWLSEFRRILTRRALSSDRAV
jgi:hypothetical protein